MRAEETRVGKSEDVGERERYCDVLAEQPEHLDGEQ
jgi:hypothetical protein